MKDQAWVKIISVLIIGVFLFTQTAYARTYSADDSMKDFFKSDFTSSLKTAAIVGLSNVVSGAISAGTGAWLTTGFTVTTCVATGIISGAVQVGSQIALASGADAHTVMLVGGVLSGIGTGVATSLTNAAATSATNAATVGTTQAIVLDAVQCGAIGGAIGLGMAEANYQMQEAGWNTVYIGLVNAVAGPLVSVGAYKVLGPNTSMGTNAGKNLGGELVGNIVKYGVKIAAYEISKNSDEDTQLVVQGLGDILGSIGGAWASNEVNPSKKYKPAQNIVFNSLKGISSMAINKLIDTSDNNLDAVFLKSLATNLVSAGALYVATGGMPERAPTMTEEDYQRQRADYALMYVKQIGLPNYVSMSADGTAGSGRTTEIDTASVGENAINIVNFYGLNNAKLVEAAETNGGLLYDYAVYSNISKGLRDQAASNIANTITPSITPLFFSNKAAPSNRPMQPTGVMRLTEVSGNVPATQNNTPSFSNGLPLTPSSMNSTGDFNDNVSKSHHTYEKSANPL